MSNCGQSLIRVRGLDILKNVLEILSTCNFREMVRENENRAQRMTYSDECEIGKDRVISV